MGLAALAAAALLALDLGGDGRRAMVQQLAPGTLQPVGHVLRAPNGMLGYAWARHGTTLALVVKPVATGQPIRLVDTRTMRVERVLQVGDRDVCGLTYDGSTLVALAADRPCYWPGGRFEVLRFSHARLRVVPLPAIHTVFAIQNLAFGDGKAFVAHAGGGIDAIDLRTGATAAHWPRRALAKGDYLIPARWLGGHLLAIGRTVVDVRTWRKRVFAPGATGIAPAGGNLVAYGPHGANVYTRSGHRLYHVLGDESVDDVHVLGRYAYAQVGLGLDVVDLQTHVDLRVVARSDVLVLLAP